MAKQTGKESMGGRIQAVRSPQKPRSPKSGRWFLWIFGPTVIVVAGIAFIFKLTEFIYVATNDGPDSMGTFLIPVMNYLLVAAGFLCMFFWAYITGQYRDVEAPKYRMLEMQAEIDREDAARS